MPQPAAPATAIPGRGAGFVLVLFAVAAGLAALLTRSVGPAYVGLVVGGYGLGIALPRTGTRRRILLRAAGIVAATAVLVLVGIAAQVVAGSHDALGLVFGLCSLAIALGLILVHTVAGARA